MGWVKKGLIYCAHEHRINWAYDSALTPTPVLLNANVIRVYFGARDQQGVSRIRYVDLNANHPQDILHVSEKPSLDIGEPGTFDDNGVILGDVVWHQDKFLMFYVGFQLVNKVKFLAFSGLAISEDKGITFKRASQAPILDRADEGRYIRAIHTATFEKTWKIWYAAGNKWEKINGVYYPSYEIKYLESPDLFHLPKAGVACISNRDQEYRIGRPRVYKKSDCYCIYYTKGEINGSYLPGYATSKDGVNWCRQDDLVGITKSEQNSWDSETLCYPSLITASGRTYMFYNGNSMGKDGFGYAEWN